MTDYIDTRPAWAQSDKKWDNYFLKIADLTAKLSKDPSSKVGAVIVNDRRILSTGYNGFIRGIADSPEWLMDRELKLKFMEHAEKNALYNALYNNVSVRGATIYTTHFPCSNCAKGLCQSGIHKVVYLKNEDFENRWQDNIINSKTMFDAVGIEYKEMINDE